MPSVEIVIIEIIGWAGAGLILGAYFLLSTNRIQGQSFAYQWMNLFGAIGLIINSGYHGAFPVLGLNVIWFGIGAVALLGLCKKMQMRQSTVSDVPDA